MSDFDKAVADSKKLTAKPSNDELLELYGTLNQPLLPPFLQEHTAFLAAVYRGTANIRYSRAIALFKVANGEDFASAPTPGMFDLKVKQLPTFPRGSRLRSKD